MDAAHGHPVADAGGFRSNQGRYRQTPSDPDITPLRNEPRAPQRTTPSKRRVVRRGTGHEIRRTAARKVENAGERWRKQILHQISVQTRGKGCTRLDGRLNTDPVTGLEQGVCTHLSAHQCKPHDQRDADPRVLQDRMHGWPMLFQTPPSA